jgi:diacylglycerol kinase
MPDPTPQPTRPDVASLSPLRRTRQSFRYAGGGLVLMWRTQSNVRVHVVLATLACALAAWLGLSPLAWAVLVLNIALVLAVEALNTALEFVVDLASPDYHQLAGAAKDTAAAAVLICATLSLAVGTCLFVPPLLERFG